MSTRVQSTEQRSSTSLQNLMAGFILFIILAVAVLNGWVVFNSYQRTLEDTENQAYNLSLSLSHHAEDTFLQVELLLQHLSELIEQDGFGEQQLPRLQQILKNRKSTLPQLNGISIYDASGNWLVNAADHPPTITNNADREYFKYHQSNPGISLYIGNVIRSRTTDELIIPVSLRLNNPDGSFAGVLLATISLSYFKLYYGYYAMGDTDVIAILKSDGHILYGRPFDDSQINRDISGNTLFMEHLKTSTSGTATFYSSVDGIERIYGYTRLKRYPIVIAAGYNKAKVFSDWKVDSTIYTAISLTLLLIISGMGAMVLKQIKNNEKNQTDLTKVRDQLTAINHTLETLALLDGLTGLANRRQFDVILRETIAQSALSGKRIALIMLDVDMFKKYNDHYGHVEGDKCLQTVSYALKSMPSRKEDLIARYGGEEFVIILMDVTEEGAVAFAERALEAIRHQRVPHEFTTLDEKIVTASAGVYLFVGTTPAQAPESVIMHADKALYQAKNNGRNRVEIAAE